MDAIEEIIAKSKEKHGSSYKVEHLNVWAHLIQVGNMLHMSPPNYPTLQAVKISKCQARVPKRRAKIMKELLLAIQRTPTIVFSHQECEFDYVANVLIRHSLKQDGCFIAMHARPFSLYRKTSLIINLYILFMNRAFMPHEYEEC